MSASPVLLQTPRHLHVQAIGSLDELPQGRAAVIESVLATGWIGERLLEMGMTPGAVVEVVRRAPFGDPLQVRLRGYLLALRRAQAALVRVRVLPATVAPASAGAV